MLKIAYVDLLGNKIKAKRKRPIVGLSYMLFLYPFLCPFLNLIHCGL